MMMIPTSVRWSILLCRPRRRPPAPPPPEEEWPANKFSNPAQRRRLRDRPASASSRRRAKLRKNQSKEEEGSLRNELFAYSELQQHA